MTDHLQRLENKPTQFLGIWKEGVSVSRWIAPVVLIGLIAGKPGLPLYQPSR